MDRSGVASILAYSMTPASPHGKQTSRENKSGGMRPAPVERGPHRNQNAHSKQRHVILTMCHARGERYVMRCVSIGSKVLLGSTMPRDVVRVCIQTSAPSRSSTCMHTVRKDNTLERSTSSTCHEGLAVPQGWPSGKAKGCKAATAASIANSG